MAVSNKKTNPTAIIPEAPRKITRKKKTPKIIAVVNPDNCTGCEACVPFCPVDCIEHVPRDQADFVGVIVDPVQVRFDECIGCKICVNVCERMAWGCYSDVSHRRRGRLLRNRTPRQIC